MDTIFDELERLILAPQLGFSVWPAARQACTAIAAGFLFGLGFSIAQAIAG